MKLLPRKVAASEALRNQLAAIEQRLGPIEYHPIADLKPYEGNPRKHPEKQIVALMASVNEFGLVMPILIDAFGVIIAGEAKFEAARRLGMTEVPTLVATHFSKAQARAYRLADNRLAEQSKWDLELLAIEIASVIEIAEVPAEVMGWATAEIDVILAGQTDDSSNANDRDAADSVPKIPSIITSRTADIWRLGDHRLLCGSSLEADSWTRLTRGKQGAMAFLDPPYNVPIGGHVSGLGKAQHAEFRMASGEMTPAQFTQFNLEYLNALSAHLKDGAILHVCMDWRHFGELLAAAREAGLALINLCVWNKTNGGMGSLYRSKHELVLVLKKGSAPHINNVELGKHGRYRTNVWDYAGANSFSATRDDDLAAHPTVKPTALVADAIRDVSHHGNIVLDAFVGSGTTILAAQRAGRIAYGIEIEPGYVDVSIMRWEAMTGQQALLESTGQPFADVAASRASIATPPSEATAAAAA